MSPHLITKRLLSKDLGHKLAYLKTSYDVLSGKGKGGTGHAGQSMTVHSNCCFISLHNPWNLYILEVGNEFDPEDSIFDGFQFCFSKSPTPPSNCSPRGPVSPDSPFAMYFISLVIKQHLAHQGLIEFHRKTRALEYYYRCPSDPPLLRGMTLRLRRGDHGYYLIASPGTKVMTPIRSPLLSSALYEINGCRMKQVTLLGTAGDNPANRSLRVATGSTEYWTSPLSLWAAETIPRQSPFEDIQHFWGLFLRESALFSEWSFSVGAPSGLKCRRIKCGDKPSTSGSAIKYIVICPGDHVEEVASFQNALSDYMGSRFNCHLERVEQVAVDGVTISDYLDSLQSIPPADICLIVFPKYSDGGYSRLKWEGLVAMGVSSQVVRLRTVRRALGDVSILDSVARQVMAKCGRMGVALSTNSMFMGVDTFHNYSFSLPSVTAVVSTLGSHSPDLPVCNQVQFVQTGHEIDDHLFMHTLTALRRWHCFNGGLPQHVLVYRDGIADKMLGLVRRTEVTQALEAVRCAFEQFNCSSLPKLLFVVVNKRISNCIYSPSREMSGTVVDSAITRSDRYDFYMTSCDLPDACPVLTYYNVLYDDCLFDPDTVHQLSLSLTRTYPTFPECTIPSVCLFAHKLANISGNYLMEPFHPDLEYKLFYL